MLQHGPLLEILGMLLPTILDADLERTRQARLLERAEAAAESDQMTGLFDRRGWDRYMEIEEARFRRFGDPGAVLVIDLDGLKEVNDTLGHQAGDELIELAASVIRETIRDCDIAARLGGDEFGIIATNVVPADCDVLVSRIFAGFRDTGVSASIGHAPYTVVAGFPGAFAVADEAMYAEKQRHRAARVAAHWPVRGRLTRHQQPMRAAFRSGRSLDAWSALRRSSTTRIETPPPVPCALPRNWVSRSTS